MSFIHELKRRNVFRMAGLYLVGAWLVVQVAATLLPVFGAPGWVMKALVALLMIGFLAALVFSWVFELTPDGLKRDADVPASESLTPQTARRMDRMLLLVMTLALAYFAFDKFVLAPQEQGSASLSTSPGESRNAATESDAGPLSNEASIAVLPFVNMSTDAENGFFADGISEELLNVLAGVQGLKVASRTSSFSFKGKDTAIPEIARQLGVRHVLEGSVRKQGQRVRITAQLIHAGTDGHLWSETYDRELTDIFKVQEEIARAITGELEGILGERKVVVAASTDNLDAYQSFLRGRTRFHRREELPAAIQDLSLAVAQDANLAEAWVFLAAAWWVAPGYHSEEEVPAAKARLESRAALERAAVLAPEHPMVPALQAQLLEDEGDFVGELALMDEAVERSVQDSSPILWRGLLLLRTGYVKEAIGVLEHARDVDPLAGINNGYLAIAYLAAARYELAEATARKALALGWSPAMRVVLYDLAARGERERAVTLWDELIAPVRTAEEAVARPFLRAVLLDPASASVPVAPRTDALSFDFELHIATRRFDLLFDQAEQVQKQALQDRRRQWWLRSAWMPSTLALREDPRFFALAEQLGMVRLWQARGWPDGCARVSALGGDRLECGGANP